MRGNNLSCSSGGTGGLGHLRGLYGILQYIIGIFVWLCHLFPAAEASWICFTNTTPFPEPSRAGCGRSNHEQQHQAHEDAKSEAPNPWVQIDLQIHAKKDRWICCNIWNWDGKYAPDFGIKTFWEILDTTSTHVHHVQPRWPVGSSKPSLRWQTKPKVQASKEPAELCWWQHERWNHGVVSQANRHCHSWLCTWMNRGSLGSLKKAFRGPPQVPSPSRRHS